MSLTIGIAIVIITLVVGIVVGRSIRGRGGATGTPAEGTPAAGGRSWLDYGNLWIVGFGILLVTLAFVGALYLLFTTPPEPDGLVTDSNQILAFLTAYFAVVGTLVGAYFAVKAGSDSTLGAQNLAGTAIGAGAILPTVVGFEPPEGAHGVSPETSVSATFSKDMNPLTITSSSFMLQERDTNVQVPGNPPTYDPISKRATFKPSSLLKDGTYFKATITTGVRDSSGNGLPMNRAWDFKVG